MLYNTRIFVPPNVLANLASNPTYPNPPERAGGSPKRARELAKSNGTVASSHACEQVCMALLARLVYVRHVVYTIDAHVFVVEIGAVPETWPGPPGRRRAQWGCGRRNSPHPGSSPSP
eukprot:9503879-Pyramimonas_sp.AAC.1